MSKHVQMDERKAKLLFQTMVKQAVLAAKASKEAAA
jgi:hypothetical protein